MREAVPSPGRDEFSMALADICINKQKEKIKFGKLLKATESKIQFLQKQVSFKTEPPDVSVRQTLTVSTQVKEKRRLSRLA